MRGLAADTMRGEGERAWGPRWSRAEAAGDVPATADGVRGSNGRQGGACGERGRGEEQRVGAATGATERPSARTGRPGRVGGGTVERDDGASAGSRGE